MKNTIIIIFLSIISLSTNAADFRQNTIRRVPLPAQVISATSGYPIPSINISVVSATAYKGDGSATAIIVSSTRLLATGSSNYTFELDETDTNTLGNLYIQMTAPDMWIFGPRGNVLKEDVYDSLYGESFGSAIAMIEDVSAMVRAAGSVLPASGGVVCAGSVFRKEGDQSSWYLDIPVMCRSSDVPNFRLEMTEVSGSYSLTKITNQWTRTPLSMTEGIGNCTPVVQHYRIDCTGLPFTQFEVNYHIINDGQDVGGVAGWLINDTTPEFVDSAENLAFQSYTQEMLVQLASGAPMASATQYVAVSTIERATPNVSSETSFYVPAGQPAFITTSVFDPDDAQTDYIILLDYNEATYDETLGKASLLRKFLVTGYSTLADIWSANLIEEASMTPEY